jgi:predicted nuclease of predicted toxin-antitoxin system
MRFVADENISRRVIDRLRADGNDVMSVAGPLAGIPDTEVLKVAEAESRILITEDQDFGELVVRQRLGIRGVVLLELDRLSTETEADRVAEVVAAHADQLAGNLIVIEPACIRVRPLTH